MRHKHKMAKKASGGRTDYYAGGNSEVAKEAGEKEQMKRGGRAKHPGKVAGGKRIASSPGQARAWRADQGQLDILADGSWFCQASL